MTWCSVWKYSPNLHMSSLNFNVALLQSIRWQTLVCEAKTSHCGENMWWFVGQHLFWKRKTMYVALNKIGNDCGWKVAYSLIKKDWNDFQKNVLMQRLLQQCFINSIFGRKCYNFYMKETHDKKIVEIRLWKVDHYISQRLLLCRTAIGSEIASDRIKKCVVVCSCMVMALQSSKYTNHIIVWKFHSKCQGVKVLNAVRPFIQMHGLIAEHFVWNEQPFVYVCHTLIFAISFPS